jgi:diacylglycerol kinase
MSAKQTASNLLNELDENASWGDVKDTIMKEYKRETGDAKADAMAAVLLCAVFVCTCVFWVSSQ